MKQLFVFFHAIQKCELILQFRGKMNLAKTFFVLFCFSFILINFREPKAIDTVMSMALKRICKAETAGHLGAHSIL